jgi:bifunctional non-homologous end joining protein LigD
VYWPKDGYTKGDLIAYYESIASIILPHLHDHPLSLNRYPNGIDMPGFYQKDLTGHVPRWLERHRVYSPSADRSIDYALCQNKESLLYLANLGCIEFHPWISRVATLEQPDCCIIDLDPDGHDYATVIKTALMVKKHCDAANIPLYPKTSGASGMHLCIPLGAQYSFDESRDLALAIAEKVHAELPQLTSLKRNPGLRRGKIYLDCFQNRRGQTLAAPYCVRPFPGAPVSTPLQWKELKAGLTPKQFTMKNIMQRLDKMGDIWLLPDAPGIDLNKAMQALSGKAPAPAKARPSTGGKSLTHRNKRSS